MGDFARRQVFEKPDSSRARVAGFDRRVAGRDDRDDPDRFVDAASARSARSADGSPRVERLEREKCLVPQLREDPSLRDEDSGLDFGFIPRLSRARGDHNRAIVPGEIGVRALNRRVVSMRSRDGAPPLIGYVDGGRSAEILERANVGCDPIRQLLRKGRLRIGVARRPKTATNSSTACTSPVFASTSSGRLPEKSTNIFSPALCDCRIVRPRSSANDDIDRKTPCTAGPWGIAPRSPTSAPRPELWPSFWRRRPCSHRGSRPPRERSDAAPNVVAGFPNLPHRQSLRRHPNRPPWRCRVAERRPGVSSNRGVHDPDLGVHDTDLGFHDAPIFAFTKLPISAIVGIRAHPRELFDCLQRHRRRHPTESLTDDSCEKRTLERAIAACLFLCDAPAEIDIDERNPGWLESFAELRKYLPYENMRLGCIS